MKALIQRVTEAQIDVESKIAAEINKGLLVFVGIKSGDLEKDRDYIIKKILNLRIFENKNGRMDKSIIDISGELLIVSQFTLYGDCNKGNRPSFIKAMPPKEAKIFYEDFVSTCTEQYPKTKSGIFQAYMNVRSINYGPVTIILDNKK